MAPRSGITTTAAPLSLADRPAGALHPAASDVGSCAGTTTALRARRTAPSRAWAAQVPRFCGRLQPGRHRRPRRCHSPTPHAAAGSPALCAVVVQVAPASSASRFTHSLAGHTDALRRPCTKRYADRGNTHQRRRACTSGRRNALADASCCGAEHRDPRRRRGPGG